MERMSKIERVEYSFNESDGLIGENHIFFIGKVFNCFPSVGVKFCLVQQVIAIMFAEQGNSMFDVVVPSAVQCLLHKPVHTTSHVGADDLPT